jgi:hypothetical protein
MPLILIAGVGLFVVMLALQVLVWRLLRVRREIAWLFGLYLAIPGVLGISLCAMRAAEPLSILAVGLLYLALAAAYIQTYPALRENIPSFRILLLVDRHSESGLSESEIVARLRGEGLFQTKVDDLVRDGLARKAPDGKLQATGSGAFLAGVFRAYRNLLGLRIGKG